MRKAVETDRWAGLAVVAAAFVALACLSVDVTNRLVDPGALTTRVDSPPMTISTVYSVGHVALAAVLGIAGLGLASSRTPAVRATLAGVAGLCAAQLAGLGAVALRRWPAVTGWSGSGMPEWTLVKTLAVVLAAAGVVATVVALSVFVRVSNPHPRALAVSIPSGTVVAVVLTLLVPGQLADGPDRVAVALQYGLPFGVTLALTGVLATVPSIVVSTGVVASAALMPLSWAFVSDVSPAVPLALVTALLNVVWRLASVAPRGRRAPARPAST